MKRQIISILKTIRSDVDYENCPAIIEDGVYSSLELIQLITALEDKFAVSIPMEEIDSENFNSVDAIVAMINRLLGKHN